jgi:hypothetical protein
VQHQRVAQIQTAQQQTGCVREQRPAAMAVNTLSTGMLERLMLSQTGTEHPFPMYFQLLGELRWVCCGACCGPAGCVWACPAAQAVPNHAHTPPD